jgi:4-oxalocrotonate tautomerase
MPYISIRVAGSLDMEQKRQIADEVSSTMQKVANKPKASCYIVFDEVSRDNCRLLFVPCTDDLEEQIRSFFAQSKIPDLVYYQQFRGLIVVEFF